jgi:tungstate transport system ATP-binding protein
MIELRDVTKRFGGRDAVRSVSLSVKEGEILALIGPSGSGKTTLLRIIGLLDTQTEGTFLIDGIPAPENESERIALRRKMAMVFQKPVIFNTMVRENAGYGLTFRNMPEQEIRRRTDEALTFVGLAEYGNRRATTLSGGEAQRLAIARAMVTEPGILLLDEPTANLDPVSTERIEQLILDIHGQRKTTVIMATHNMAQGRRLAGRIAVMDAGRIVQVGNPDEIFSRPANLNVARLVGIENILTGTVVRHEKGLADIDLGGGHILSAVANAGEGENVTACIRGEEVAIEVPAEVRTSVRNRWPGTISSASADGPVVRIKGRVGTHHLTAYVTRRSWTELGLREGDAVTLSFKATAVHVIRNVPGL